MPHVVIGTAGHIDHGKSALVKALTGTDPDRLKEEKARGITIDLGFAHWASDDLHVAFVDVPGHERFVRNMLAGVGGIDCVLLVVAADESVMPQTREHFEICRLLEIRAGLIALTKSDLVDAETLDLVRLEVKELVQGSVLQDSPVVAVSSRTGAGLDDLRAALLALGRRAGGRPSDGMPRLPIDRVFSMKGFGTVVTGTLVSGHITVDQELLALPAGTSVKVRGLQVHGHKEPRAEAGQRVALNLGGVEVADLTRGDTLTVMDSLPVTRVVDAALELLADAKPLRHGARVRFHQGTAEIMGRLGVSSVLGEHEAVTAQIPPGRRAFVRIRLEQPVVVTRGDRFILRAYSPPVTIAGGQILDPTPPRSGLRTAGGRTRFERLRFRPDVDVSAVLSGSSSQGSAASTSEPWQVAGPTGIQGSPDETLSRRGAHSSLPGEAERPPRAKLENDAALAWMIEEAGSAGLPVRRVIARAGVAPHEVPPTIDRLIAGKHATVAGQLLLAPNVIEHLKQQLVAALRAHHQTDLLSEGLPREEARVRIFGRAGPGVFERALEDLVRDQAIEVRDKIALRGHRVSLSAEEQRAMTTIEDAYRNAGLKPIEQAAVAPELRLPTDVADRMIKLLVRQKKLMRVDTLLFHESALRQLKEDVTTLKRHATGATQIDVATFKQRYGITRKFAIPLLEYLDRERITRRVGDVRQVL
ncbi:MAG: selenocysteine-specific translation elongation factor [Acidobacteria bacterium]|nr:selenocysteine-specific translation elongation factor [Acidobacteriota bacterium]